MIRCSQCSFPICDFCKHLDHFRDSAGIETGEGWCSRHARTMQLYEDCDDFYCFRADALSERWRRQLRRLWALYRWRSRHLRRRLEEIAGAPAGECVAAAEMQVLVRTLKG